MTGAFLFACVLLAAPASAQQLAGPEVEQTTVPGVPEAFAGEPDRMDMTARVPMDVFVRALRSLQADEATRLGDAQREAIMKTMAGFRRAAAPFEREHRGELHRLRRQAAEMDDPARDVDPERMDELRERGEAMRRAAPDPSDAQRKVWAELNDAQRAVVEVEIEAWRAEQDERAIGRMTKRFEPKIGERLEQAELTDERVRASDLPESVKQRLLQLPVKERTAAVGRARPGLLQSPDLRARIEHIDGPVTDEMLAELLLPERAKQRLARLTPDQRARVLRRFARGEVGGGRDRGDRRESPGSGLSPEPPPMERVPLPEPHDD